MSERKQVDRQDLIRSYATSAQSAWGAAAKSPTGGDDEGDDVGIDDYMSMGRHAAAYTNIMSNERDRRCFTGAT
jgi:hypothetical protein